MTFAAIGGAFAVAGLLLAARNVLFLRRATTVQGKVVGLEPRSGTHGRTYAIVFEYTSPAGTHQVRNDSPNSHPGVEVGESVPVKFDPRHPEKGRLAKPFHLWGLPGFFLLMGLVFLLAGAA